MKIPQYLDAVSKTDKLPPNKLSPVLFGLYGEIGELLTLAKRNIGNKTFVPMINTSLQLQTRSGCILVFVLSYDRLNLNSEEIFKCLPKDLNSLEPYQDSHFSNESLDISLF